MEIGGGLLRHNFFFARTGIDLPEELDSAKAIAQKAFDSLKAAVVADMRARLG